VECPVSYLLVKTGLRRRVNQAGRGTYSVMLEAVAVFDQSVIEFKPAFPIPAPGAVER
jgi:hypothetical protein